MKKVSMQDIADNLGISKCTVSLVLNGKAKNKRVSKDLCERVIKTARQMNYQPNEIARGLRTGYTKTIGVVVADISNEFFGQMVHHIQMRAKRYGYSVIITNTDESLSEMMEMITLLINRQVDGIIMVPSNGSEEIVRHVIDMNIPLVQLDRFFSGLNASYVVLDNYKASADTTRLLVRRGCKRIAMIRHKMSVINDRLEGYVEVLRESGCYCPELVKDIEYTNEDEDIKNAIMDLYNNNDGMDAVFFQSHELFLSGIKHIMRLGIRIPHEMQIASYDDINAYNLLNFPMIYVEQPIQQMAEKTVDVIMDHINGSDIVQQYKFEAKLCFLHQ